MSIRTPHLETNVRRPMGIAQIVRIGSQRVLKQTSLQALRADVHERTCAPIGTVVDEGDGGPFITYYLKGFVNPFKYTPKWGVEWKLIDTRSFGPVIGHFNTTIDQTSYVETALGIFDGALALLNYGDILVKPSELELYANWEQINTEEFNDLRMKYGSEWNFQHIMDENVLYTESDIKRTLVEYFNANPAQFCTDGAYTKSSFHFKTSLQYVAFRIRADDTYVVLPSVNSVEERLIRYFVVDLRRLFRITQFDISEKNLGSIKAPLEKFLHEEDDEGDETWYDDDEPVPALLHLIDQYARSDMSEVSSAVIRNRDLINIIRRESS